MDLGIFEKIYTEESEKAILYILRKLEGQGSVEVAQDLFSDSVMALKERYLDTGEVKDYTGAVKLLYGIIRRGGVNKFFQENGQTVSLTIFDQDGGEERQQDFSEKNSIQNNQVFYSRRHLKELEYQRAYLKKWYQENKWRYKEYEKNRNITPEQIKRRNIIRLIRYYENKRDILEKMKNDYRKDPGKYIERVKKYQAKHPRKKKEKIIVYYWLKDRQIPDGYYLIK